MQGRGAARRPVGGRGGGGGPARCRLHDRPARRCLVAAAVHRRRDVLRVAVRRRPRRSSRTSSAKAEKGEPLAPMSLPAKITIVVDNTFDVVSEQLTRNVVGMVEGIRSGAEGHVRDVRRAPRSHRLQPDRRRRASRRRRLPRAERAVAGGGQGRRARWFRIRTRVAAAAAGAAARAPAARRGAAAVRTARHHQQRRRRRRLGIDGAAGDREGVRDRSEAEAIGRVRLAHRRGERACTARATTPTFPSCRSTRCRRSSTWTWSAATTATTSKATTRNTRLHRRRRSDQHRSAQPHRRDQPTHGEAADARLRAERSGRSRERLHAQRSLQLRGEGHSDRVLHDRPASRLSPRDATRSTRSCFPKMARIAQLVYETGFSIANTERMLERDNKGPRTGFGAKAEVLKK